MSMFDDQKKAHENRFAHDQELEFKAQARRNRQLGLWAAELLGKTGEAADAYAKDVIVADFEQPGDDDVFAKVRKDFDAAGVAQTDDQIRSKMEELLNIARDEVKAAG